MDQNFEEFVSDEVTRLVIFHHTKNCQPTHVCQIILIVSEVYVGGETLALPRYCQKCFYALKKPNVPNSLELLAP